MQNYYSFTSLHDEQYQRKFLTYIIINRRFSDAGFMERKDAR